MAPRGRPRKKVGQTRMDAAIDALSPMGFPTRLIRSKVNALLKVYDGEWAFIEESAYRVLLDLMVEDQDETQNKEAMEDGDSGSDGAEPSSAHDGAETSTLNDAEPSNAHDVAETSTLNDAEPSPSGNTSNPQAVGGQKWKDISCMDHERPQDMAVETAANKDGLKGVPGVLQRTVRQPCYGWIGSDDEEEDCVFFETEASQRKKMHRGLGSQKDQKCRWDVKQGA